MWQEPPALRDFGPTSVADGSGADVTHLLSDVRCTPQSGQTADMLACPLSARNGLMHCSKIDRYSISSSARMRSDSGTSSPSVLAVLRFTSNSTLVGCST